MSSVRRHGGQRGFSLAEVMVATAILVVILVGILMLYDRANTTFKSGNEAAELQQTVRIAYDRMVSDVRMAGFDYKRGGPLLPGQTAAAWAPGRAYTAGTLVTPPTPNGHVYRAINNGTSGGTPPPFCTATGCSTSEPLATPPITWIENGGAVYEQPDEQVEYAGATALTIRGNFDYSANETGDTDHGREPSLEGPQFPMVTTDNGEIVTYALRSDGNPAANTQSVEMYIDINAPGTPQARTAYPGSTYPREREVTIPNVDLTNNNPPYTLYRFTFAPDATLLATALATNIRSLNFFYYEDQNGTKPLTNAAGVAVPNLGGNGRYDSAVPNSINDPDRLVRRKIRSIRVRLIGMNSQADQNFADTSTATGQFYGATTSAGQPIFATDTGSAVLNAGPPSVTMPMTKYRRLAVDTVIVPRNLGLSGMKQTFLQPPPAPTIESVCIGYCGIAVVNWNPNTNSPNASYVVMWDTSPTGGFSNSFDAGTSNSFAVDLTQQDLTQNFYFRVRAFNAGGGAISPIFGPVSAVNATKPNPPTNVLASGGSLPGSPAPIAGRIRLSWSAPSGNASGGPSCTPSGTPSTTNFLREIKGFRIYRKSGASSGFNAGASTRILDENAAGPTAPQTDGYGNYWWDDTAPVCGTQYWYRVQAVEWCDVQSAYNSPANVSMSESDYSPANTASAVLGLSGTTGTPAAPVNFVAQPTSPTPQTPPPTLSYCDSVANTCDVLLNWTKVTQDLATPPNTIAIDDYDVEREQFLNGASTGPAAILPLQRNNATSITGSTVDYVDRGVPYRDLISGLNYEYHYRVRAHQNGCPNGNWSNIAIFPPPCSFTGSVLVQSGASAGDGLTPATAWVMNAGDTVQVSPPSGTTFSNVTMDIVDPNGVLISSTPQPSTNPANFTWANLVPSTIYTVTFTMTNNPPVTTPPTPPCTEQVVRYIEQEPVPACALLDFSTQSNIVSPTSTPLQLELDLVNTSAEDLILTSIDFTWSQPAGILWNNVKFPSSASATVNVGGSPPSTFTVNLNPKPAQLTISDITVPASAKLPLFLNFGRSSGTNNVTPSTISTICVKYTRASVSGFTFSCTIKPQPNAKNPNSCN